MSNHFELHAKLDDIKLDVFSLTIKIILANHQIKSKEIYKENEKINEKLQCKVRHLFY